MLKIEQIKDSGRWFITLNGACIHGGLYSEREALHYLRSYQKIWDAGYEAAKEGYEFIKGDASTPCGTGSDYLDCLLGVGGFGKYGPINKAIGE